MMQNYELIALFGIVGIMGLGLMFPILHHIARRGI